jgi:hypothetical protein
MLDDLRNSSSFIDEPETPEQEEEAVRRRTVHQRSQVTFLGMTAQQRFILSLLLFFMVCALGVFALIATGSIAIPGI